MIGRLSAALVLLLGLAVAAAPASAQSVWRDRDHSSSMLLEALFSAYQDTDTDFGTWTWFLSTRVRTGTDEWIEIEVPYSRLGVSDEYEATIGNPYIGIEVAPRPEKGVRAELGVRLPLTSDDYEVAAANGYLADVERQEAFIPRLITLHTAVHYHRSAFAAPSGIGYDVRLTPEILIPVGSGIPTGPSGRAELQFGYLATIQRASPLVRVGLGFTGRWIVTNDSGDFGENSNHQIDLAADFLRGPIRPGLQIKLPLDEDLTDIEDFVWGVTLSILPGHVGP